MSFKLFLITTLVALNLGVYRTTCAIVVEGTITLVNVYVDLVVFTRIAGTS